MGAFHHVNPAKLAAMAILGVDGAGRDPLSQQFLDGARHWHGGFSRPGDENSTEAAEGIAGAPGNKILSVEVKVSVNRALRVRRIERGPKYTHRVRPELS
jgi:hypothetical protein